MKLCINGEVREAIAGSNLTELIASLGLPAPAVIVEHNGVALRREEWTGLTLAEGDRLEIIRIVAGGKLNRCNELLAVLQRVVF